MGMEVFGVAHLLRSTIIFWHIIVVVLLVYVAVGIPVNPAMKK
jgi:hypothetical protein